MANDDMTKYDTVITIENMDDEKLYDMWDITFPAGAYIEDEDLRKKVIAIVKNKTKKDTITYEDIINYMTSYNDEIVQDDVYDAIRDSINYQYNNIK